MKWRRDEVGCKRMRVGVGGETDGGKGLGG